MNKRCLHSRLLQPGLFFIVLHSHLAFGQTSVYNQNTDIFVSAGTLIYVPGNYIDQSNSPDGRLYLEGQMFLKGDFQNNGSTTGINAVSGAGTLVFTGTSPQTILGSHAVSVPNLQINKAAASVNLSVDLNVVYSISMVNGNLLLSSANILLYNDAVISGEKNSSRIYGDGTVEIFTLSVESDLTDYNYHGIGIGFGTVGESFSNAVIKRLHTPSYQVANGTNSTKSFNISASNTDNLSTLHFNYLDNTELNGMAEGGLAIYVSEDAGSTWVKDTSSVETTGDRVMASGVLLSNNPDRRITLADSDCIDALKPSDDVIIATGFPTMEGNILKVCLNDDITLSSNAYYYTWTKPGGEVLVNEPLTISDIDFNYDLKYYTLYIRNQRGCERRRTIQIDVLPLPVASFSHIPPNSTSCFGDVVNFTDASTGVDPGLNIVQWAWDFDDLGAVSSIKNPAYEFSEPRRFNVELIVTNQYGCVSDNGIDDDVFVHPLPIVDFAAVDMEIPTYSFCEHEQFPLDNLSSYININGDSMDDPSIGMTHQWQFGNGTSGYCLGIILIRSMVPRQ